MITKTLNPPAAPAIVTVDMAVFTVRHDTFEVLLIRRGNEPFKGDLALPGGFLEAGENLDEAARRELVEETGLRPDRVHLEQFRSYGAPQRDPRGRVVTVAYLALLASPPEAVAGGDASAVEWTSVQDVVDGRLKLAFDHRDIIGDAAEHACQRLETTTIATAFCPPEFTMSQLRRVYEIVWNQKLDPRNFHRKITKMDGFLVPTGRNTIRDGGRPAALYRTGRAVALQPPLYRQAADSAGI